MTPYIILGLCAIGLFYVKLFCWLYLFCLFCFLFMLLFGLSFNRGLRKNIIVLKSDVTAQGSLSAAVQRS